MVIDRGLIRVQQYQRKAGPAHFSLERVFEAVRIALPVGFSVDTHRCPFESRHILKRILNIIDASFHQRDVNHIVGDVHYLALGMAKQKTILTIHDCCILRLRKGWGRTFLLWFWYRLPVKAVSAVTVISEFTRGEVLKYTGCDPLMVHVIHNPLSEGFSASPKVFCQKKPVILLVGTTAHNKNVCRVAESLRGVPCCLDIVGRLSKDQQLALERNQIEYLAQSGLSEGQMVDKYRQCDMVVFASIYEGFGMPIIEANATGRPVVTSKIGPMPEVAGPAACLVDPFDCSSIRTGILRVIEDSAYRDELIAQGYENVQRFRPEIIAQRYADLYRKIYAQG